MNYSKIKRRKETGTILGRYFKSFKNACGGINYAIKNEHNMIIILCAIALTSILGIIFSLTTYEWLFIIISYGLVMGTEMINTSFEAMTDLITEETKQLARLTKDTMAGATLVFVIMSFIGALIIFIPHIIKLF